MEEINKNSAISFQEENNVDSPDKTNTVKELNDSQGPNQVPITVQNELKKIYFQ